MVRAQRRMEQEVSLEIRSFLLSFPSVKLFASAARGHWGVENRLHWVLDVAFREDDSRVRLGHAAENLAVEKTITWNLRNFADSLLKVGTIFRSYTLLVITSSPTGSGRSGAEKLFSGHMPRLHVFGLSDERELEKLFCHLCPLTVSGRWNQA